MNMRGSLWALGVLTTLVVACGRVPPVAPPVGQPTPPPFSLDPVPLPLVPQQDAQLFIDGDEIFPMLEGILTQAQRRIQIDYFMLGGDIGIKLARILEQKQRQGVRVDLMLDPNFGFSGPSAEQMKRVLPILEQAGIPFRVYPLERMPAPKGSLNKKFQIDHNKLIAIDDGAVATIGSMNLFDGAVMNHDIMFKITGPVAQQMSQMMTFEFQQGKMPSLRTQALPGDLQEPQMRLTMTSPERQDTKLILLDNIQKARQSVWVAMFEFADLDVCKALIEAHKRGVEVRVLLERKDQQDKYVSGTPVPAGIPNILAARELVEAHVPVHWYNPTKPQEELHMKMALFDDIRVMAGSTNYTLNAFKHYRETGIEITGGQAVRRLVQMYDYDWQNKSTPLLQLTLGQKAVAKVVELMQGTGNAIW